MKIGYARCSTEGQSLESQIEALREAGCEVILKEKVSGDRKELGRALKALTGGSVLYVSRLDRLARSTRDLLNVLDLVGKAGAQFKSLNDPWADTTTPHGRLMLTVLGGLAEFERSLIIARTTEGRKRAVARGVKLGPKFKLTASQREYVAKERAKGEGVRQIAKVLGVSPATIGRIPPI